jgi:hypothetical protein
MPCTYRILRDNKERGPLGLEELLQLNLKPFDLIWVEGRSAGWRYPSEIDSLKPYLNTGEPVAQPAMAVTQPAVAVTQTAVVVIPPPVTPAVPMRSSPAETPVSYAQPAPAPDGEVELTAEALQSKADEIYRRVQAYNQKKEREGEGVETKYARSLEDLKQEYADWLHGKKSKKRGKVGKKQVALGSSIAALAAIAVFFFLFDSRETAGLAQVPDQSLVKSAVKSVTQKSDKDIRTPAVPTAQPVAEKPAAAYPQMASSGSSVDRFLDSVERVLAQQERMARYYPKKHTSSSKPVVNNSLSTVNEAPVPETIVKAEAPVRKVALSKQVSLSARYMHDDNRRTISGLEVTVKNNSDVLLQEVTVDVFYYKKGEKLFEKETLYFHNIYPHSAITLATPGNKKAITARFQLGQVNSNDVSFIE